jgi:hypothetical protein
MVCGANYNAHTDPLFEKINSLKFDDPVNFNLLKLGSRIVKRLAAPGVASAFRLS